MGKRHSEKKVGILQQVYFLSTNTRVATPSSTPDDPCRRRHPGLKILFPPSACFDAVSADLRYLHSQVNDGDNLIQPIDARNVAEVLMAIVDDPVSEAKA